MITIFNARSGCAQQASADQSAGTHALAKLGPSNNSGAIDPSGVLAPLAATSDTFEGFFRFTAEDQNFIQMQPTSAAASTAYYRDVFVGGETFSSGANDGDAINAQMFDGNSNLIATWDSFVFHSSYVSNGQTLQDCWVAPFIAPLCGSTSIDVLWYRQSQCGDGNFSMKFFRNGVQFSSGNFTVLPQIEESRVTAYNQVPYDLKPEWAYDSECRYVDADGKIIDSTEKHECSDPYLDNEIPYYIRAKGCFLSAAANLLTYHRDTVDPPTLNTALNGMADGYQGFAVNPDGVHAYSVQQGHEVSFAGRNGDVSANVCHYGPQIMGVKCVTSKKTGRRSATHWVTVYGQTQNKSTWLIHDPNGGQATTLAAKYNNDFCESRAFSGPEFVFVTEKGVRIRFHSPVELLVTDSLGRRLGDDPIAGVFYDEIPDAYYDSAGLEDDATGVLESDPAKVIYIPRAATGQYTVTVTGTDNSAYTAEFITKDANGTPSETDLKNVPIGLNQVQTFTFNYSDIPGSTLQLTGGFDGGGQRPKDVNRFLTFANPTDSQVTLATGTTSYTVVLFYGDTTIPSTFSAVLNGVDISSQFHPAPGGIDAIAITLQPGRNLLDLKISGNLPTRVATDTDRLVFNVK